MQKIRPTVALSRYDRLPETMQEFRIYGRADHILDTIIKTSLESTEKKQKKQGTRLYRDIYRDLQNKQNVQGHKTH